MLVHAHPDDESTGTGATMARYANEGATVSLVTCTSGELGEVVADDLAHLRGNPDALGEHRRGEIAEALRELGDIRHHWLGGPGRFRDSGMAGEDTNDAAECFAKADRDDVTRAMVEILRAERPHVVVTYDDTGGYGHPDHIAANHALMYALGPAADPAYLPELGEPWDVPKVYWMTLPRSFVKDVQAAGIEGFEPFTVPDEDITAVLDGRDHHAKKLAALRTYRSQVSLDDGDFFATLVQDPRFAIEHYVLVRGERGPGSGPHNWENDLFAGLD
ncbi:N-acetyl-1-D-myo-inositol-2-amino-2-deoxy-alpha-D-glucopyranoside deacetylase [Saccharopolyspora erythraea]|uniref:1D-myo-inositol 2-acetamido-2-deoxy-alpha-D-glucopyranoside deacetylase 2 n=2 Tax=Saccharopolyspora erythraea TaxID=1836 RepID=MSHB2_SACEN|nr:N-acetyl-1-D-myo-inositol-2-amino-2-deoxy-alpha-D-glucopyranoside deacetylase [Saccharopolyspora erythraea]A4F9Z0.1 RecName: Full=1D-myo-inositol 2-acetamido-2-deoxy-alpha-D-glucopyranoside deacetylase 2; Short=GlcNAc-Ins deacetylase 2; AltName: Full=N-acetyl-1-D-myo-inositol 2-amino-2-deoxy-alpha-D-glucopyranoside deacetylase 2 [Saccharopolyspora erythraea NRRL 2338]QRK93393.1 N-acetyl-1-D-myo-inositol-2-amino-2-deoxy-alpha-D-glucopyranoside deacetylase [Saccharopolyspora erythraea]CAM00865.